MRHVWRLPWIVVTAGIFLAVYAGALCLWGAARLVGAQKFLNRRIRGERK